MTSKKERKDQERQNHMDARAKALRENLKRRKLRQKELKAQEKGKA